MSMHTQLSHKPGIDLSCFKVFPNLNAEVSITPIVFIKTVFLKSSILVHVGIYPKVVFPINDKDGIQHQGFNDRQLSERSEQIEIVFVKPKANKFLFLNMVYVNNLPKRRAIHSQVISPIKVKDRLKNRLAH